MSEMRIISSSIVQATNHQKSSRIDLSPWDLVILPVAQIQKGLLFQKPTPDMQETLIHHLKASLSKTLDYFPPLAGRLSTVDHEEDDSISYFIDCNNAGALFIHAAADSVSISDIIKSVYVPKIVHSFFPLNGLKNYEGVSNPLLGIQALLCHTWRSVIRNININGDEVIFYCFAIGARQRLQELHESYFGNAIHGTVLSMKAKELLEEGIGKAALQMNRVIAAMTEQSLKSFLVSWAASPRMASMAFVTNMSKVLSVNSSPWFNMYGNDFGWGKPIAVRSGPELKYDAKTTLFCGAEEGSIDIEARLSLETLEAMANDEEFMDSVAF
ncbi:Transferase [Corchorus olitorius]|uniref:Transferase n=1 Tax=Corchorus olitorius TaxID=93759 RepID=A0A1R3GJB8_9ROSI|nr:Transferase [Corchorus olitorius]